MANAGTCFRIYGIESNGFDAMMDGAPDVAEYAFCVDTLMLRLTQPHDEDWIGTNIFSQHPRARKAVRKWYMNHDGSIVLVSIFEQNPDIFHKTLEQWRATKSSLVRWYKAEPDCADTA